MIRNRNDLIVYLEDHSPQPCICRAVCEGQVEYLGMFRGLPPGGCHWLIVKVTSKHGKMWYVATAFHYLLKNPKPFVVKEVIWKNWMGDPRVYNMLGGDHPEKYKELRDDYKKRELSQDKRCT